MSNKIYEDLCYKDKRNPMYSDLYDEDDNPTPRKDCFCDNCFHDIDKRALQTLELVEALKELKKQIFAHHKMNVKKDFSLLLADAAASKAIHKAEEGA